MLVTPRYRLWPESHADHLGVLAFYVELYRDLLLHLGLDVVLRVVHPDRVVVVRAPADGVLTLCQVSPLVEYSELPLDELAEEGLYRDELPSPVHAVSRNVHPALQLLAKVVRYEEGIRHLGHRFVVDAEGLQLLYELGVLLLHPLGYRKYRRPGRVYRHGVQDVVSPHPLVSRERVGRAVGSEVAYVLRHVRVRERRGDHVGGLVVRVALEYLRSFPRRVPLLLDFLVVHHLNTVNDY